MDRQQLHPIADSILVPSYLATASYSRGFLDEFGQPPTVQSKAHHLRSVVQAKMGGDDRYELEPQWAEFGRVQFLDRSTGQSYLLRSSGAVTIEGAKRQSTLFESMRYLRSGVALLVYRFHEEGLDLSIAGTRQQIGRRRLEASGHPTFIGTWGYTPNESDVFDQGYIDPFGEIGAVDLGDEEAGEG